MKQLFADGIGVDAGMIMVACMSYVKEMKGYDEAGLSLGVVLDCNDGLWEVHWSIPETWHGKIEGDNPLKVSSGYVVVIDPCYLIDDQGDWEDWLDETHYGEQLKTNKAFVIDEMGGDGEYNVRLDMS